MSIMAALRSRPSTRVPCARTSPHTASPSSGKPSMAAPAAWAIRSTCATPGATSSSSKTPPSTPTAAPENSLQAGPIPRAREKVAAKLTKEDGHAHRVQTRLPAASPQNRTRLTRYLLCRDHLRHHRGVERVDQRLAGSARLEAVLAHQRHRRD